MGKSPNFKSYEMTAHIRIERRSQISISGQIRGVAGDFFAFERGKR